ncbi:unnamed protein product [Penicillium salamii]|uniref:Nephrocystin 3-like N-terminal domain-containing protein n=1 Tax=Penicillium salamii TaxID=1612424 RepID=A0A9W4IAX8_9EURO|nr:unnamed protein product [Penicillium salamii]
MEIRSHTKNRFGDVSSSGDGTAFQVGVNNGTININQRARQILLPNVVYNATFDAANKEHVPSCLQGTRVEVLKKIQTWIEGDNSKKVYWLSGMAGTGKSTIALTLARTYKGAIGTKDCQRNVCLGATFFFSRGGGDLSSASKFPATIAIQLAEASGELQRLIGGVVENSPRIDSLGVQAQWGKLVIEPLSLLSQISGNRATLLLIVDALDECNDPDDTHTIIRCLEEVTHMEGIGCRVFLTSRPEHHIRLGMDDSALAPRENFILYNIDRSIVDQDLQLYYRDQLCRIKATMPSEEDLISERVIGKLVERSNGLFIHAATVCKFVRDGGWLAVERLNQLLETQKSDSAELELNKMYTVVLEYSFASVTNGLTPDEVGKVHQLFQCVIGAIIVMFDTISSDSLANLLGVKRDSIIVTLSALHSVINVPERHSEPIRILHPSFREFLLDPNRCTNKFYLILVSSAHGRLLTRCVAYLMSHLKRNILDISKPGTKARDVLMERIDEKMPMELQYSSRYWWSHFQNSDNHSRKELPLLEFLEDKYLFWLESLAWLGKLGPAIEAILNLDAILIGKSLESEFSTSMPSNHRKSKTTSQLHTFVPDALKFLLINKLMIEEAPLQLYVSALIFSPNSSEVRKTNLNEIPSWVLNEPRVPGSWSKSSHGISIAQPSGIHFLAISPDGSLVATACGDCMVHILDVLTGTERLQLEGNMDGLASVCFSPNGCLVASFAQNCVSVWNIEAALGAKCQPVCQFRFRRQGFGGLQGNHPTCAISPSGNLVTVVDFPRDIWVWDMRVKQSVKYHFQIQPAVHRRHIRSVYFSSDESLLICITIRVPDLAGKSDKREILECWSTSTGTKVLTKKSVLRGPLLEIRSGTKFLTISRRVSNSGPRLVTRDARTGLDDVGIPLGCGRLSPISALCNPADGKVLLASLSGHGIIVSVLGEHTKETFLINHSYKVRMIEFSSNGKYLISVTSFKEMRIWNIERFESKPSRLGEIYHGLMDMGSNWCRPISMALNLNQTKAPQDEFGFWVRCHEGSLLATGALGGSTITIWDTKTGEEKFRFNAPNGGLNHPTFSKSGNVFAVVGKSGVKFWETKTGKKGDILKIDGLKTDSVGTLHISAKGKRVICARESILNGQKVSQFYGWELDGLRKISTFEIPVRSLGHISIVLSPSEELYCLWVRGSAVIEIGSFPSNTLRCTALRGVAQMVGFMPDGEHVWILSELEEVRKQAIHIWNIEQDGLREVYIKLSLNFPPPLLEGPEDDDSYESWHEDERTREYGPEYEDGFVSTDGKLLALTSRQWSSSRLDIDLFKIADLKALFRLHLNFQTKYIQFAPSGTHLITERGNDLLPDASPPFPLLFATQSWIQEDDEDILAIPPSYQDSLRGMDGHTITFRDLVGGPLFVRLDEGTKSMTA